METIKINSNISVNYISMTKLKTTSVGVYIHRPLTKKEASMNALLPMVLKRASKALPNREEIEAALDNLYGATMGATVLKMGEDQVIYFDAETISDKYAPNGERLVSQLLQLLMSVIFEPKVIDNAFDEKIVEQEKIGLIDKIDAFVNDKRQYASTRCQSETARGTDFEIFKYGSKEEIEKITAQSLYSYYKSIITSSVIDIYICGDADVNSVKDTVVDLVSGIEFEKGEITENSIVRRDTSEINRVTETMDVKQGKLALGFLTNISPKDEDAYALAVFNSVFGAGAHSKIFNNVREKLSLAYYASSQLEKFKGLLIVNAGIEFENFQKAYDEILAQLEEIRKGNISEHEFNSSINTIVNMCQSYYDDQRALATYNLSEKLFGTNRELSEYIENIQKVSIDDVVRVSKKLQLDTVYFLKGKVEK